MRIVFYALTVAVAAVVTWALSMVILRLSHRYRLYPKIRSRDVHTQPTPRLGGVAMFLGVVVAIGSAWLIPPLRSAFGEPWQVVTILLAALLVVVMGVVDDLLDLNWYTKLAGQFIVAGIVAFGGTQVTSLPIGDTIIGSPLQSLILTVFVIVLVMNAVNFVDGLDGLVAGVAIIANGTFFVYTYLQQSANNLSYFNLAALVTVVLIGVCVGFLPVNFHPARMFMGDSGALLVGLLMAVSAISVTGYINPGSIGAVVGHSILLDAYIPILLPFAILAIPLLDFGLAVLRRLRAGKSPFSADRKHLHHRLLDMGHSHLHAVLIFYAWTLVASVGLLLFLFIPWWGAVTFIAVGFIITSGFTLAPLSRRKRAEVHAQRTEVAEAAPGEDVAKLDPLDVAAVPETEAEGINR
ncbi:MAG: UDP-GlcNAc:undecaprenyl-phosphate/decaprenyl-phosphate GlcNAc-phosphate transferase [Actinomycetota bacterium]|jgi:UDP-GlcNAc:undecaprenyl-phosphate GlcNAc-1-phosphate transferase|nr:UDP-GlcNAc:undecaprenyl-phosphate/decaprenyl-phosphate GlcNAc-phosphate transferase [Actinomycetota bacterium]